MNTKERLTKNHCRKNIRQSEYIFTPTIKINMVKLLPNEAAASGAEPNVPTIKLSTTPIIMKPSCPIITGYAK